jgi:hypothetical protein
MIKIHYASADILQLIREVREAIVNTHGINQDKYLTPMVIIENTFSQLYLNSQMNIFSNGIELSLISNLSFMSDNLYKDYFESKINEEDLASLRNDVSELVDQILHSDLPVELKELFIKHLELIKSALLNYELLGNEGLYKVIDSFTGAIFRNRDSIDQINDKNKVSFFNIIKLIETINKITTFGKTLLALGSWFTPHPQTVDLVDITNTQPIDIA